MGPLALAAKAAGWEVYGSDLKAGAILPELLEAGVKVKIGTQDGEFLRAVGALDWFVYTSSLPEDHAELKLAREMGLKISKRDELTAFLVEKMGLKMVAVAGTHGKTTTTAMIVFAGLKLGLPIAYVVGTTLGFAKSGGYTPGDRYFVYEADEYDRNFLRFWPWRAVITTVSHDHFDIYPTAEEYEAAFRQFQAQSEKVIVGDRAMKIESGGVAKIEGDGAVKDFKLAGVIRKKDALLAKLAIMEILADLRAQGETFNIAERDVVAVLNEFPGVGRRFEKISEGIYSDYAHHPEEIVATIEVAQEEARRLGKKGVVVIYQPHQNTRQHQVFDRYSQAFVGVDKLFWLPTYLTREDAKLKTLAPEDFIQSLENQEVAEAAGMDSELGKKLKKYQKEGYLVVLMAAGPADEWMRRVFS